MNQAPGGRAAALGQRWRGRAPVGNSASSSGAGSGAAAPRISATASASAGCAAQRGVRARGQIPLPGFLGRPARSPGPGCGHHPGARIASAEGAGPQVAWTRAACEQAARRCAAALAARAGATPLRPARPVRPLRCSSASASFGSSAWMTSRDRAGRCRARRRRWRRRPGRGRRAGLQRVVALGLRELAGERDGGEAALQQAAVQWRTASRVPQKTSAPGASKKRSRLTTACSISCGATWSARYSMSRMRPSLVADVAIRSASC